MLPKSGIAGTQRAVFLDRDGVINQCEVRDGKPYAPRALEDFELLPRVIPAVRMLKDAGLLVIVGTNQPDIGNGLVDVVVVEAMHDVLRKRLPLDDIKMCPHRQDEGCDCRKPKPGMLIAAAKERNIDLSRSFMVGDRWGDIVAGQAAGCYTFMLDRGYREPRLAEPNKYTKSLYTASQAILATL